MRIGLVLGLALGSSCVSEERLRVGVAEPALLCDDLGVTLVRVDVPGVLFAVSDALTDTPQLNPPRVTLEPHSGLAVGSPPETDRVVEVPQDRVRLLDGDTLRVEIDAGLGLTSGAWTITVQNGDGETASAEGALVVASAPKLSGFRPDAVCQASDASPVSLVGEGFLVINGLAPTVLVGGTEATVVGSAGCEPLAGPTPGEVCTEIAITYDATGEALGGMPVVLTNPSPAGCVTREPATVEVLAPPVVTAVSPTAVCRLGQAEVLVTGSGFLEGVGVEIGGVAASSVTFVDETRVLAALDPNTPVGLDDVVVVGPHGCDDTLEAALQVVSEPLVFLVDPPVAWSGAAISVQAFVSDVVGLLDDVWLADPTGGRVEVVWTWDPAVPGVVQFEVPAGLPDGEYGVFVSQDGSCAGGLEGGLSILGALTIPVESITPRFAWVFDHTPVDVKAALVPGPGEVPFLDTPRLLLVGPAPAVEAQPLLGVDFENGSVLHAVIPPSLDVGTYDLLVVNPDGALGLLPAAIEVTFDAPPGITAISPGTLPNSTGQQVAIYGHDFRDPVVEADCLEAGVVRTVGAPVLDWNFATITASFPAEQFGQAVCLVRVTNVDGTVAEWSAVSITNPAQNLFPWQAGSDLVEARRGLAAAAGRTTSVQRWVYAIGGDDGTAAGAKTSIEVAPIDVYGALGPWVGLSRGLPAPRTLAGVAVIGRFIYLVGGNDAASPTATVVRAQILDPLDVPYLSSLSVVPGPTGLGPGAWTYRVAATYDPTDLGNPGGESLPSDPIQVNLPDVADLLQPRLSWTPVDGAVGYRVYRTPKAGSSSSNTEFLGDVAGLSFTDVGGSTTPGLPPLEPGALGAWAPIADLSISRESPCLAVIPDPFPDPYVQYLYAAGGKDELGGVADSVEVLPITIVSDREQVAGTWSTSPIALSEPRYQCAGYGVDSSRHSVVPPGVSWVYFAGGLDDADRSTGTVDAGRVVAGGGLTDWQTIDTFSPTRVGFAYASASDFLYLFGGQNGAPNQSGTSGQITVDSLPDVENWNSLGNALSEDRYLPGSAQESAVIFVIGGQTSTDAASRTVDFTNF